jgi:hypothetical protein
MGLIRFSGQKTHWLLLGLLGAANALQLRTGNSEGAQMAPAEAPEIQYDKEWNAKNIVGLIGGLLVIIFLFLSFVFADQFRRKIVKLKVVQVAVVPKKTGDGNEAETPRNLSAVIKVNSDNPLHFVIPVDSEVSETGASKCTFEVDALAFEQVTFSLIIRDGNIPIHFATLSGGKIVSKSELVPGSKKTRRLNIDNVQEDEERLKDKQIVLLFEINK